MGRILLRNACFLGFVMFITTLSLFLMSVHLTPSGEHTTIVPPSRSLSVFSSFSSEKGEERREERGEERGEEREGKFIPDHHAICTITAKNYIGRVRTLVESFRVHNPSVPVFVLLVDRPDGYFDPAAENYTIIMLEDLQIPEANDMLFRYNSKEACTSFKPVFMKYLLERYFVHKLVYLDPDIWVQDSFGELWDMLSDHSIVVTPHIVEPLPEDGKRQNDIKILRAGTMNLGFLGVNQQFSETHDFLDWWDLRLRAGGAMVKIEDGYHYDQKWVDLAFSFYDRVLILRDQAYNVAYWNLHERGHLIEQRDDGNYYIGKATRHTRVRRIVFFHFSGLDSKNIGAISHHQNRFTLADLPNLEPIFSTYVSSWRRHVTPSDMETWPYTYDVFVDGTPISYFIRKVYRDLEITPEMGDMREDPFLNFLLYIRQPVDPGGSFPRFLYELWNVRADLQCRFPVPFEEPHNLVSWYRQQCVHKSKDCILEI